MCTEHLSSARTSTGALSRRTALLATAGLATAGTVSLAGASSASAAPRKHGLADLTYVLGPDFPAFADGEEASGEVATTIADDGYYMLKWAIYEHTGTHVDAPAHFNPEGRYATELKPEELVVPAVVVDISRKAARDPDAVVTVADLQANEKRYGRIEAGSAVLMLSGWGAKVGSVTAYRGTDAEGGLHFPGFDPDATEWLIAKRRIKALGVDTLSIDPGVSEEFGTHTILNGAERYGIENVANLDKVPPRGARITVGLIPFKDGSGGPARVFAAW